MAGLKKVRMLNKDYGRVSFTTKEGLYRAALKLSYELAFSSSSGKLFHSSGATVLKALSRRKSYHYR